MTFSKNEIPEESDTNYTKEKCYAEVRDVTMVDDMRGDRWDNIPHITASSRYLQIQNMLADTLETTEGKPFKATVRQTRLFNPESVRAPDGTYSLSINFIVEVTCSQYRLQSISFQAYRASRTNSILNSWKIMGMPYLLFIFDSSKSYREVWGSTVASWDPVGSCYFCRFPERVYWVLKASREFQLVPPKSGENIVIFESV